MNDSGNDGADNRESQHARELRRAFDASFAQPARGRVADVERLLLLQLGGDGYAFRLAEIGGLTAARKIVPIASTIPEVLGLAGVRGNLVPVYSLSALLGYGTETEPPRWFVGCRDAEPIAFGFATLDGYAELAMSAVHATNAPRTHVQALVRTKEGAKEKAKEEDRERTMAVLDVASLVAAIQQRVKER